MARTLDELYGYLDRQRGRCALDELQRELEELEVEVEDVEDFVKYADRTYRRNLMRGGEAYNVWVLCWRNGQRSPIHDHKGSSCCIRVLEGTMTETLFSLAP